MPVSDRSEPRVKPRLRGVSHQYAFFACLGPGIALITAAPTTRATVAASIYAASVACLFGTSALYHRITWTPRARRIMARIDVAMVFALIAGTYTPISLLVLDGSLATRALIAVWSGAVVGSVVQGLWTRPPKWVTASLGLAVGWMGVIMAHEVVGSMGGAPLALFAAGGLLYTAGAIIYALQRPDPVPAVFGYHEVFHAIVVVAAAVHFVAVAFYVVPA